MTFQIQRREVRAQQRPWRGRITLFCIALFFAWADVRAAEPLSSVVVFNDAGFPSGDSASPSLEQLQKMLPGARLASVEQLRSLLHASTTRLFVLPYGSAFPEEAWTDI